MRKILYIICLSLIFFQVWYADSSSMFWLDKIDDVFKSWDGDLVSTGNNILGYIIWLFYFIAVSFWIYGWFTILVSAWDEEKVKKWKNIVIYVVLWLIVIFLASQIVHWVINVMWDTDIVG